MGSILIDGEKRERKGLEKMVRTVDSNEERESDERSGVEAVDTGKKNRKQREVGTRERDYQIENGKKRKRRSPNDRNVYESGKESSKARK